jgi:glycerophosphoryl diester phosphodiesterase
VLTGADFDIESIQKGRDGSFSIGDEFGPFVLHVAASGELLEAPFPTPGVQSDSNPFIPAGTGTLPNSRGFEGMAISPDGRFLYPMLEGALKTDPDPKLTLRIFEFDTVTKAFTGRLWRYRLENPGNALGDLQAIKTMGFSSSSGTEPRDPPRRSRSSSRSIYRRPSPRAS